METLPINDQFAAMTANLSDLRTTGDQMAPVQASEITETVEAVPFGPFADAIGKHAQAALLGERGILKSVDSGTGEERVEGCYWLSPREEGESLRSDIKHLS